MSSRLKVRFLTVIWGERYIEEFERISLPSYLAPGNLPYMAQATDLEVVILTSKESVPAFHKSEYFRKLETVCPVKFIYIDDLITDGMYGVVLTLAYARGVRSYGADQVNTHFVFMNSDFVLADGSLRTLVREMEAGKSCVMVSSLRANAEAVADDLEKRVDREAGALTMKPREMVQLALDNLHPTVMGKTASQDFVNCTTYNQLYWQVDRQTLLGRCHLIFMLMIKPEVSLGPVNSYCDYGLVPELVPSGDIHAIEDSDDFFMMETQPSRQEIEFLRCGKMQPVIVAKSLSQWCTQEHRRCADFEFVFHSADLGANFETVRAEADRFVTEVRRRMPKAAKDHKEHYYWVSGVEAWSFLRKQKHAADESAGDADTLPPEFFPSPEYLAQRESNEPPAASMVRYPLAASPHKIVPRFRHRLFFFLKRRVYLAFIERIRRAKGIYPEVSKWSSKWADANLLMTWIAAINSGDQKKNLLICDRQSLLPEFVSSRAHFDNVGEDDILDNRPVSEIRYDNVLIHTHREDILRLPELIDYGLAVASRTAKLGIFIDHPNNEMDQSNFRYELAQYISAVMPREWLGMKVTARFAGGRFKRFLRLQELRLAKYLYPSSLWGIPLALVAAALLPVLTLLTYANNFRMGKATADCPEYCSSVLLMLEYADR